MGGAIAIRYSAQEGMGDFLWTHTTNSMIVGYMSTSNTVAKVRWLSITTIYDYLLYQIIYKYSTQYSVIPFSESNFLTDCNKCGKKGHRWRYLFQTAMIRRPIIHRLSCRCVREFYTFYIHKPWNFDSIIYLSRLLF